MPGKMIAIDGYLAATLRERCTVDASWFRDPDTDGAVIERINYHGIAGLLCEVPGAMDGWHGDTAARVRTVARAQTMWELRHREYLQTLFGALAGAGITVLALKGTALAYDLYPSPASRARGDSDVLIEPQDLAATRTILAGQGYVCITNNDPLADDFRLQEVWSRTCGGGMAHQIDLHWQLLNAQALAGVFPFAECARGAIPLPGLGPDAAAMDRVCTLIHTCIHRSMSFTSPYFIDERTYYGGDRLIWLTDIHLLASSFSPAQWATFCGIAGDKRVSAVCLEGLLAAQRSLGTAVPASVCRELGSATGDSGPAGYLRSRQLGRAWRDVKAIPGLQRKLLYLRARAVPTRAFMRDKYPGHAGLPLPLLHARRLVELVRPRPKAPPKR